MSLWTRSVVYEVLPEVASGLPPLGIGGTGQRVNALDARRHWHRCSWSTASCSPTTTSMPGPKRCPGGTARGLVGEARKCVLTCGNVGAAYRNRTDDLLITSESAGLH